MVKLENIIELLEKSAPLFYASEWDNVGLMIGSIKSDVTRVMVCLDVTPDVVNQAVEKKCQLIISHHPLFFRSLDIIDYETPKGNMIRSIIRNDIAVYSCHTNMDSAEEGINSALADLFGIKNAEVLDVNSNFSDVGIGRIGVLEKEISFSDLCEQAKKNLGTDYLKVVCEDLNKPIKKLCVASGSCGDLIILAASKGADAIITGDVKYHEALDAADLGIAVIDAGHYPTENLVCNIFSGIIKNTNVEVYPAITSDVFKFI